MVGTFKTAPFRKNGISALCRSPKWFRRRRLYHALGWSLYCAGRWHTLIETGVRQPNCFSFLGDNGLFPPVVARLAPAGKCKAIVAKCCPQKKDPVVTPICARVRKDVKVRGASGSMHRSFDRVAF